MSEIPLVGGGFNPQTCSIEEVQTTTVSSHTDQCCMNKQDKK